MANDTNIYLITFAYMQKQINVNEVQMVFS